MLPLSSFRRPSGPVAAAAAAAAAGVAAVAAAVVCCRCWLSSVVSIEGRRKKNN